MTLLRPTTGHLFSKGVDNQKEVLPSIVRAEVSKSVGLIHIGGKGKGTGFRVGEKYIVTCEHVIKDVISGISPTYLNAFTKFNSLNFLQKLSEHSQLCRN